MAMKDRLAEETQNRGAKLGAKKIYLCEADEYVGPFCSREDAERFLALVALFGGSCKGIEIMELDSEWHQNTADLVNPSQLQCCGK